jgi:hypothetical protein
MSEHELRQSPFKARSASTFGPEFKITEAMTKLEQSTAHLVAGMTKLGDIAKTMANSHHSGMSFFHALMSGPHVRRDINGFWTDFYRAGRRIGFNSSPLSPANLKPLGHLADSITERSRHAFAASSALAANGLKAASPAAFATLEKSWTLWQAKAFGSLVKPASRLVMRLQDGAEWWGHQGQGTKDAIGWGVAGTVAATGATLALGTFTRAVRDCASAARFAAGIFEGMRAAKNVAAVTNGPAAVTAAATTGAAVAKTGAVAGEGTAAVGNVAKTGRFANALGRVGKLATGVGKFSGWMTAGLAAFDMLDNIQGAFGPNKKYSANNFTFGLPLPTDFIAIPLGNARESKMSEDETSGYGGRLRKEGMRNNFGAITALPKQAMFGQQLTDITGYKSDWLNFVDRNGPALPAMVLGQKMNKWASDFEESLGLSRSFGKDGQGGLFSGKGSDTQGTGGPYNMEPQSRLQPAFMAIEDVYRSVTLAALESPLDQKNRMAQDQNDQAMLKELQTANGHLEKLSGMPPAMRTR